MRFRIRSSHIIALCITAGIAGWMATGTVEFGGRVDANEHVVAIAEREAERSAELFKVRYVAIKPEQRRETVLVRGRTAADAIVSIRAETSGILERRLVSKGERVEAGDLVCVIEQGTRQARVAQAEAQLALAEADHEANLQLKQKGFASQNKLNQMKATLDAAKASLAEARWELERTEVRANASGIVQDPTAEPGDMLSVGGTCVTLIDTDPMLFVGQISEREVARVARDMEAKVTLVGGQALDGRVRYIARAADPSTRTFLTEIEIADPDGLVRDGLTASAVIELAPTQAYRISPSWITLADNGQIGLRAVDGDDIVRFVPIAILAQTNEGFWVSGPEPEMRIITVGQEYVVSGEKVDAVPDENLLKAALAGGVVTGAR